MKLLLQLITLNNPIFKSLIICRILTILEGISMEIEYIIKTESIYHLFLLMLILFISGIIILIRKLKLLG
jgi:hypothetical protein